jgi:hypothetical protein
MKINLRIERLVLEGLRLENHHGPIVKAAIEAELGRLLAKRSLVPDLSAELATPALRTRDLNLTANPNPGEMGRAIARSLHQAMSDQGNHNRD